MQKMNKNAVQLRPRIQNDLNSNDLLLIADKDGQRILVHRNVLEQKSDYFSAMFRCGMQESTQNHVTLKEVCGDQLIPLVNYCYTGDILVAEENVQDLMATASLLQFKEVEDICASFLQTKLNPSNCLGIFALAEYYYSRALMLRANEFICEHFEEVCKSEEFMELDVHNLSKLIANSNLNVTGEENIFASVMAWIQHKPKDRHLHIRRLLKLVRLPLLPLHFLNSFIKPFFRQYDCEDLLREDRQMRVKARKGSCLLALFSMSPNNGISVDRYCPRSDQWKHFVEIPSSRHAFASVVLNEEILVIGGRINDADEILNSVECFDIETKISKQLAPMLTKRHNLGAAVVDGFVFAVGGIANEVPVNTVERYDPVKDSWSLVAPMLIAVYDAAVTALNGHLYVVGGGGSDGVNKKTTQVYDPVLNKWTLKADMKLGRKNFGVAANKGKLYTVGRIQSRYGNTVECYDSKTDEWRDICDISNNPFFAFCAVLSGDRLMTVYTKIKDSTKTLAVDVFNTKTNAFQQGEDSPLDLQRFLSLCAVIVIP